MLLASSKWSHLQYLKLAFCLAKLSLIILMSFHGGMKLMQNLENFFVNFIANIPTLKWKGIIDNISTS